MMDATMVVRIVIGVVVGLFIAFFNTHSGNNSISMNLVIYLTEIFFGALGSISADQFIKYGPSIDGSSIVPDFVGALVLGLIVLWTIKLIAFFV